MTLALEGFIQNSLNCKKINKHILMQSKLSPKKSLLPLDINFTQEAGEAEQSKIIITGPVLQPPLTVPHSAEMQCPC